MPDRQDQSVNPLIEDLFDAASDLPPEQRAQFVDAHLDLAGESHRAIRAEVMRLLEHHDLCGVLDEPLIASDPESSNLAALEPGEVIAGRFRIERMIGAGGMGEVYETQDLIAGQTVALKTIRADIANDEAQAERFRRELLISRNIAHRNVCKVFDYGEFERGSKGRLHFFTMELLHGVTLAQRLAAEGRLAPDVALMILGQVAAGLDEVHRSGIIHRDLKPSNIFLVWEGDARERAVVMDFGLARDLSAADLRQTRTGMVMGTRLYMPPELPQKSGFFSDIYSFGVVALEVVTGAASPLVAPRSTVPSLDASWDRALLACFNLDPAKRPSSASQVVAMLRLRSYPWRKAAIAAGVAVACLAAGAIAWNRISPALSVSQVTFDSGVTCNPASSADGKLLAYASDRNAPGDLNIWLQNVGTGEIRQITNDPADDDEPALSPDGRSIAWRTGRERVLNIQPTAGGAVRALARDALSPQFSPDGRYIAYWTGVDGERNSPGRAWVVPAAGGAAREIVPGFADARLPGWSADGKSILFRGVRSAAPSLEAAQDWWIASLDGKSYRPTGIGPRLRAANVQPHDSAALWKGSRLLFAGRVGTAINLFSMGYYPLVGPIGAVQAITTEGGLQNVPVELSGDRIAYAAWHERVHIYRIDLSSGVATHITDKETIDSRVSSSSDGSALAFGRRLGVVRKIWIKDLRASPPGDGERELTDQELALPAISPDGRTVAVSADSVIRLIDVRTKAQSLACKDCGELRGWLRNSRGLLYVDRKGLSPSIRVLDLSTGYQATLLSGPGLDEAAISPDGKTIAFTIRTAIHSTIFLSRLTREGADGPREAISALDGSAYRPVWSPDGRTLYYLSDRDGFLCVWSSRIDALHLRALGGPEPIYHFHKARETPSHLSPVSFGLSVGGNGLFVSISLTDANIWAIRN